jgi:branched-subunit amino acid transport protein AzlD
MSVVKSNINIFLNTYWPIFCIGVGILTLFVAKFLLFDLPRQKEELVDHLEKMREIIEELVVCFTDFEKNSKTNGFPDLYCFWHETIDTCLMRMGFLKIKGSKIFEEKENILLNILLCNGAFHENDFHIKARPYARRLFFNRVEKQTDPDFFSDANFTVEYIKKRLLVDLKKMLEEKW